MTGKKEKKIVLRFLKEMGLYHKWTEYIKRHKEIKNNWYKATHVDRIIGKTNFTEFVNNTSKDITIKPHITQMFREYLKTFYPDMPMMYSSRDNTIIINKETHTIHIK